MVVVPFVCAAADRETFQHPITWMSKTQLFWQVNLYGDVIVGSLGALRASQGQFNGTVSNCLLNNNNRYPFGTPVTGLTHADTPEPGEAFYYLVKPDPSWCFSWGTGSPAEVPGAGGDRDLDLAYDPHVCPSIY